MNNHKKTEEDERKKTMSRNIILEYFRRLGKHFLSS